MVILDKLRSAKAETDPDGNNIEIMQFTEESEQLKETVE